MSLIAATQITAIATGVLAFFAIITAGFAYFAFRAQSTQVGILKDQEERAAEERRRGQAARLYLTEQASPGQATIPASVQMPGGRAARGTSVAVTVHNTSEQPVYDLRIHWVDWATTVQAGGDDELGTLGPSDAAESERELPGNVTVGQFHAIAYFRDAAGLRWTLTTDGQLKPVPPELRPGASSIATGAAASNVPDGSAWPLPRRRMSGHQGLSAKLDNKQRNSTISPVGGAQQAAQLSHGGPPTAWWVAPGPQLHQAVGGPGHRARACALAGRPARADKFNRAPATRRLRGPSPGDLRPGHAWATSRERSRLPAVTSEHSTPASQQEQRSW